MAFTIKEDKKTKTLWDLFSAGHIEPGENCFTMKYGSKRVGYKRYYASLDKDCYIVCKGLVHENAAVGTSVDANLLEYFQKLDIVDGKFATPSKFAASVAKYHFGDPKRRETGWGKVSYHDKLLCRIREAAGHHVKYTKSPKAKGKRGAKKKAGRRKVKVKTVPASGKKSPKAKTSSKTSTKMAPKKRGTKIVSESGPEDIYQAALLAEFYEIVNSAAKPSDGAKKKRKRVPAKKGKAKATIKRTKKAASRTTPVKKSRAKASAVRKTAAARSHPSPQLRRSGAALAKKAGDSHAHATISDHQYVNMLQKTGIPHSAVVKSPRSSRSSPKTTSCDVLDIGGTRTGPTVSILLEV